MGKKYLIVQSHSQNADTFSGLSVLKYFLSTLIEQFFSIIQNWFYLFDNMRSSG